MNQAHTCAGCGYHFASGDGVATTVTDNYAEFCVSEDFCWECRHKIRKAIKQLHKKEAKLNHG